MFKVNKNRKIIYKLYNKIKFNKKIILFISYGVDSNLIKNEIKKIKNKTNIININHNICIIDKKINKKNLKYKIKIKIKKNIEKILRKKRYKKIKNIFIKKKANNIWVFQHENDIIENYIIQIFKINKIIKKKYKKKKYKFIKKVKPINKIKKKYIKKISIKNKNKWIEEKDNIKYKNIRNKIRINIIQIIEKYIKNFKKNTIKNIYKRDVAERLKAFPC